MGNTKAKAPSEINWPEHAVEAGLMLLGIIAKEFEIGYCLNYIVKFGHGKHILIVDNKCFEGYGVNSLKQVILDAIIYLIAWHPKIKSFVDALREVLIEKQNGEDNCIAG